MGGWLAGCLIVRMRVVLRVCCQTPRPQFTPPPPPPPPLPPTGYVLDADSPAALRPQWDRGAQRRVAQTAGSKNLKAVQAGWGDALAGGPPLNPHFSEEELRGYRCVWV